eukprot:gb/GEZN01005509.1/.p1 GENE.gb/GEZN01005509.1/~~gb/GEZN01005509.1/.p1  ORF type:complete len:474 (-),score=86.44 gb/GEZN01005509.1/:374-1723(-)
MTSLPALGKVSEGVLHLDSDNCEQYMSKFSFSPNEAGEIKADFQVIPHPNAPPAYFDNRPHSLQMLLYSEEKFEKFQKMIKEGSLCNQRVQEASMQFKISPAQENKQTGRIHIDWPVYPQEVTHYWYAVVADCWLEEYPAHPPSLAFTITFMNGASHLPADEKGMQTFMGITLLVLLAVAVVFVVQAGRNYKNSGQVHLAVLVLGAALSLEFLSVFCEFLHLRKYARDGKGYRWQTSWMALDFLAEVFQGESELVLSLLLIFVSFGWTLMEKSNFQPFQNVNKKSVLFSLLLLLLQICLEVASRQFEDDFNQFHDHEHWPGMVFLGLRVLLCGLFWYGTRCTLQNSSKPTSQKFLFKLRLLGCVWFLAFPCLVLVQPFVSPHMRHFVVTTGSISSQIVAMSLLGFLLTSSSTEYFKVSSLRQMGDILPGAGANSSMGAGLSLTKKIAAD